MQRVTRLGEKSSQPAKQAGFNAPASGSGVLTLDPVPAILSFDLEIFSMRGRSMAE
jgi:hypothetical protein